MSDETQQESGQPADEVELRGRPQEPEEVDDSKSAPEDRAAKGPFDVSEVPAMRPYVDFGGIKVAPREGLQLRLEVDEKGLDQLDRRYLDQIAHHFGGGPVGIETIAAALSEPRDAIEDIIEPFLIQQGLIQRTPRGRVLTANAWKHLGLEAPTDLAAAQMRLFEEE